MERVKDLWFDEMESRLNNKLAQGISFDQAYNEAANEAERGVIDRLANMPDNEYNQRKENAYKAFIKYCTT